MVKTEIGDNWVTISVDGIPITERDKHIIEAAARALGKYIELFARKQHDYGPCNIVDFGEMGIVVRMNDKFRRLRNILEKGIAMNEAKEDTYMDIIGYALIGLLVSNGEWEADCDEFA